MQDAEIDSVKTRAIRVFISSTFKDMKREREELVKQVFPRLRKLCDRRGVSWGAIDLRWGITDEQQAEGEVLPICLGEIENCKPFFIGMLGERYGWIPKEIPAELLEKEPWLDKHRECSVTEMEILHGVLNDPKAAKHAYFYLRNPSHVESPPETKQDEQREESNRMKLTSLKDRIRNSGLSVRENYSGPKELGELVLKDFTELIDRLFPEGSELDPLGREALEHEAYAQARFRIYVSREEHFQRLDEFVQGNENPLVLLGESGAGKSALLANWASRYCESHPDGFILSHFIGATPYSADWAAMLRRILGEFKRRYDIPGDIPTDPQKLRAEFAFGLHLASAAANKMNERIILILDGLNQLEDKDSALDLVWLPPMIPENIRLIVSTLPGPTLDSINKREWPVMEVTPLDNEEQRKLIRDYIGQYRKALSEERVEQIASSAPTRNPLFLRALLEELRVFGMHEHLDRVIEHYISSSSVPELFEKVLKRLEQDCEPEWPGLIEDAMSFIWASRRGLSEEELLELLGAGGNPLPRAQWVKFSTAVEKLVVSRSGLMNFAHGYIREAIQEKYLPRKEDCNAIHQRLADYFTRQSISPRKVDELPWLLTEAGSWKQANDLLVDPGFFKEAWEEDKFEVKRYWSRIEASSEHRMVESFQPLLDRPDDVSDKEILLCLSRLLADTHHNSEVLSLLQYLANFYRRAGDLKKLGDCLRYQARIFFNRGHLDGAMGLCKEQERISRELDDLGGLARSLGNQVLIHIKRGDLDAAMTLSNEEEDIWRALGDSVGLYRCLGNQGLIHKSRGDLDRAMELHKEAENICREIGDPGGLWHCVGNQANILNRRGDREGAMKYLREQECICRELGDTDGLQRSLGNQATVLIDDSNLDSAMALLKEQECICREINNPEGLSHALAFQADILAKGGNSAEALLLVEEAYSIATKHGYAPMINEIKPVLERIRSEKT